jgi:hypothetical protein
VVGNLAQFNHKLFESSERFGVMGEDCAPSSGPLVDYLFGRNGKLLFSGRPLERPVLPNFD